MERWIFGWIPGNPHSLLSRTNHPTLLSKLMDSVIDYGSFGKLVEILVLSSSNGGVAPTPRGQLSSPRVVIPHI